MRVALCVLGFPHSKTGSSCYLHFPFLIYHLFFLSSMQFTLYLLNLSIHTSNNCILNIQSPIMKPRTLYVFICLYIIRIGYSNVFGSNQKSRSHFIEHIKNISAIQMFPIYDWYRNYPSPMSSSVGKWTRPNLIYMHKVLRERWQKRYYRTKQNMIQ